MTEIDIEWDEDRGGNRDPRAFISSPEDGLLVRATQKALPWIECGAHDTARKILPVVFVERLLRKAPVSQPSNTRLHCFIDETLSLAGFIVPALN